MNETDKWDADRKKRKPRFEIDPFLVITFVILLGWFIRVNSITKFERAERVIDGERFMFLS